MAEPIKGVTEDCVTFVDVDGNVINIVPFSKLSFCPRIGETVSLTGENGAGGGLFEVTEVVHNFIDDKGGEHPSPGKSLSVKVHVRRKKRAP